MNQYFFSFDRKSHLILIKIKFSGISSEQTELHLPLWRPGRYQAQNFARNITLFHAESNGKPLSWKKTEKNIWSVDTTGVSEMVVGYTYYAYEMNAGSSFVNEDLIYINPVNLTMFRKADMDSTFEIRIDRDDKTAQLACGLHPVLLDSEFRFRVQGYYTFFDSPLLISPNLGHILFGVSGFPFHFWIYGRHDIDTSRLIEDLSQVAAYQIRMFGSFPEKEYHFMLLIPVNSFYHGVEHRNSTVLVLSDQGVLTAESYTELLGLASHELFHAWNIAKIRPKELLPYDYTRESYFETCFVAEGFTTYYGDRVLFDSGVFTHEQYRHELETTLKRHFAAHDYACQSLLESSFDLWVDGYEAGVPDKKVSVYHKGAIVTLILDSMIRQKHAGKQSMEDVMRLLYNEFGDLQKGYSYHDIVRLSEQVYGGDLSHFFKTYIEGTPSVFNPLQQAVKFFGMELQKEDNGIVLTLQSG